MKKTVKKMKTLQLNRETIRLLSEGVLSNVQGGAPTFGCQTVSCGLTDCC